LSIEELDGVQWIHGDGKPDCSHWPEIYQNLPSFSDYSGSDIRHQSDTKNIAGGL